MSGRNFFMRWLHIMIAVAAAIQVASTTACVCPICQGIAPRKPTFADELRDAHDVVVVSATTLPDAIEVHSVIKGDATLKGTRVEASGIKGPALILSRAAADAPWESQGASGPQLADFLKALFEVPAKQPANDAEWDKRLIRFRPFLGHLDPRISRSACAEWARAPYRVIRSQKVEPEQLRAWLLDPSQSFATPLWLVLLGISGGTEDARRMDEQLDVAWKEHDATLAPALLTARIEREGEKGVAWLEDHYIRDRDRTLDEVKAAVAALSVQGESNAALRPRILAACHLMLTERRPLGGLVASDLNAWGDGSAQEHFESLLASGEPVLPEARLKINEYLKAWHKKALPPSERYLPMKKFLERPHRSIGGPGRIRSQGLRLR